MKYVKYGHGKWRKTNYLIFDKNGIGFVDLLRNEKYVYGIIDKEGNSKEEWQTTIEQKEQ